MKGLYVARLDLGQPHLMGVARKIDAQIKALAAAGMPTRLLCIRDGAIELDGRIIGKPVRGRWDKRFNHHLRFHRAMEQAALDADFAYIRFQGAPPGFVSALARLRRVRPRMPILLEIPTWPYRDERRGLRTHVVGTFDDFGVGAIKRYVDRVVSFSKSVNIFGVETLRTSNGVEVETTRIASEGWPSQHVRLIGIANLAFWHGYDRVIEGLALRQSVEGACPVFFDIVGAGQELEPLQKLAKARGLNSTVRFHGPVYGKQLDEIFDGCDAGVGCLGLHRVQKDTSDLKTREYCARGLPFLSDRLETDFLDISEAVYVASSDDSPIDIASVEAWLSRLGQVRGKLRSHAETNLSWHSKLKPVIDWLRARNGPQPAP